MGEVTALIADIQHCSLHDGPGIRTTVFVKGCPLNCVWCHNPECISLRPEVMYHADKCIGCGHCAEGCFSGARVTCGREMTLDEVMEELRRDKPYYGGSGGLTLSGGEPAIYPEFSAALLDRCAAEGIGRALETSLYAAPEVLMPLLRRCDIVMCDLKHSDPELHKKYTGAGNALILENLRLLDSLGIPIILRTPVIAGLNDDDENISAAAVIAASLKNLKYYELLPYHPLGVSKAAALGREQTRFEAPSPERFRELAEIVKSRSVPLRIAGRGTDI